MRPLLLLVLLAAALPLSAATGDVSVEIPRLQVSEYHRPYVAVWIERPDRSVAAHLAAWYQQDASTDNQSGKSEPGTRWLADLRQWWRRTGRELDLPVDGVSGATRPVGQHRLRFGNGEALATDLEPGAYRLVVEAAREVGGRELLAIGFDWPPAARRHLAVQGEHELGAITLDLDP